MTYQEAIKTIEANYPPENYSMLREALDMAIELLKEQELKPVEIYRKAYWYGFVCVCPDCKVKWMSDKPDTHFCPNCERVVEWR